MAALPQYHPVYGSELLTVLHYFDYFHYPLTPAEIRRYCSVKLEPAALVLSLTALVQSGAIETQDGYYGISHIAANVAERRSGAERYEQLLPRIVRSAVTVKQFPFVRFVGLSGSLSKGYAAADADIDLFVITDRNRLWICRTLLHMYKKISFLKGHQHWYCMNYFIDDSALILEEQNYYTAVELTTMKPLYDPDGLQEQILSLNLGWIQQQLPGYDLQTEKTWVGTGTAYGRSLLTALSGFSWLNRLLMQLTDIKWRAKWKRKQYPLADYEQAFKTRINISKNHYHNYQKKLLKHLEQVQSLLRS